MTRVNTFNLHGTLRRIDDLVPARMQVLPPDDLEWILADFMLSWGQRLLFDPATWPSAEVRERSRPMGERYLPFSMVADFTTVNKHDLYCLSGALASHGLYILLVDEIVDETETIPSTKYILQHLLAHAYEGYQKLFPAGSVFWEEVKQCTMRTTLAMTEEVERQKAQVHVYSPDEFRRIAVDKGAIACITPIALSILDGRPERIPALLDCFDALALSAAIQDDIRDWRRDYEARNFTFLLSQVLTASPFRLDVETGRLPTVKQIEAALLCSEILEHLYDLAHTPLALAVDQAAKMNCPAIARLLEKSLFQLRNEYNNLIKRKLTILLTQPVRKPLSDVAG